MAKSTKITVWNKLIQELVLSKDADSILLAVALLTESKYLYYWIWADETYYHHIYSGDIGNLPHLEIAGAIEAWSDCFSEATEGRSRCFGSIDFCNKCTRRLEIGYQNYLNDRKHDSI